MPIPQNELVELLINLAANLKESDLEDPATFSQVSALVQILDPKAEKLPPELVQQVSQIPNKADRFKAVMQAMGAEPTKEVMDQVVESMKASGLLNKAEDLDKGKNGDWKKEGYKIYYRSWKDDSGEGKKIHSLSAHDSNGNEVGEALFREKGSALHPIDGTGNFSVWVDEEHQRKGLGSAMYVLAEKKSGLKIIRSDIQEPDGEAFWNQPNRKFGKSEELEKGADWGTPLFQTHDWKYLGSGHQGHVYQATPDVVVKVSKTTPYNKFNPKKTPAEARGDIMSEHDAITGMAGNPLTPKHHGTWRKGDKLYLARESLTPIKDGELNEHELAHVRESLHDAFVAGHKPIDNIQLGRNAKGELKIMDMGGFAKRSRASSTLDLFDNQDLKIHLRNLYEKHGIKDYTASTPTTMLADQIEEYSKPPRSYFVDPKEIEHKKTELARRQAVKPESLDKVDYHLGTPAKVHGWITPEGDYIHMQPHEDHLDVIRNGHGISSISDAYDQGWISVGHAGMEEASGHHAVIGNRRHPATLKLRELAHKHWGPTFGVTIKPEQGDNWQFHEADTNTFAKYGKIKSANIDKSELDKGALKDAAAGLAILSATAMATPTSPSAGVVPARVSPKVELKGSLRHIASIESSDGKNKKHQKTTVGLNAGDTAAGSTGLMPITVKEAIKKNPKLMERHSNILSMSSDQITQHLNNNPSIEADIANHHWDRLHHVFGGDKPRMAYAWRNGITAAKNATQEQIDSHPYVQKFNKLSGQMNKSEELEKVKSPHKNMTQSQLERFADNNWHNPDTGVEISQEEGEAQLKRLQQKKADKKVQSQIKVIEGGKKEAPKENPADWFDESIPSKLKKAQEITNKLNKHIFDGKSGKLHGWVSPEGDFHPMKPNESHMDWIAEKTGENATAALDSGWIAVGHGGDASFSAAHPIIANKRHPATLKLRQIFGDAYPGQTMNGDIYHYGDTHTPSESHVGVSVDHFAKHGKFKQ
jgi:GNAT superfamily N-acetyltransferase